MALGTGTASATTSRGDASPFGRLDQSQRLYILLCAIFVTCLLLGDITGGKAFATPVGPVSVGLLVFPVTFLLTDLEGSTRMWERDPEAMRAAMVRHDELLEKAVAANDGFVGWSFLISTTAASTKRNSTTRS